MTNPKKLAVFLSLLLMCWHQGYTQTGTIGIQILGPKVISYPYSLQTVGDHLSIQVMVNSTNQINSVTASVPGGQGVPLIYSGPSSGYTGTMSLLGLPEDTTTLTVTAVDAYNNTATATALFVYDHPPALTIDSPAAYTVALPNLHVRTRCHSDSGACTIVVVLSPQASTNVTLGTYTDSADANYDLSAYEGLNGEGTNSMYLAVSGTDKRGMASNAAPFIPVYVETSPYLTPVFSADKKIYDLSGNKVFAMQDGLSSQPHIMDITNGLVTNIPFTGYINTLTPHLTSTGAVFPAESVSEEVPGGWSNFFEWHNGSLDSVGRLADPPSNVFAGDYGTCSQYSSMNSVTYRDLATQTNQVIPNLSATSYLAPSPSGGILAYQTSGSKTGEILWNLYSFANGGATVVVDDSSGYAYPYGNTMLTDGKHVLYARVNTGTNNSSLIFGGAGNYFDTLATFPPGVTGSYLVPYSYSGYFRINNGYSAYLNPSSQGVDQVWIRDTTGIKKQLTFYGSTFVGNASLEYLNPKGELSYFMPGQISSPTQRTYPTRAIYTPAGGSVSIGGMQGQAYYMDSAWYVVIGRTVFKLDLAITPNKSDNFTVNVRPDSLYGLTAGTFDAHFEGSGYPTKVVFTRLPAHGTLTVKGVSVSANTAVPRASLQNLVYTPATGFTGVDTVNWFGATDYTISVDTAQLLLNVNVVVTPPAQPAITGLDSVYCSNGGTAVFTMTNFPDTTGGVAEVIDSLDNKPLTIGAGASCSIALSGLSAGVHAVKVTYTNAGGSSSLLATFRVVAASTPAVGISASYTTMPDTAASVVVKASDVSGGGSLPQYTFSLNGNFSPVLYGPGAADSLVIDSAALVVGANTVYVRMQTSDSCYTALNATDSIVITRTNKGGNNNGGGNGGGNNNGGNNNNNSNDSTSSTLTVGPNPFQDQLVINGLQSTHAYTISLLNGNGMETVRVQVSGVTSTSFFAGAVPSGIYLLRVYDETTGKMGRMIRLMGLRK